MVYSYHSDHAVFSERTPSGFWNKVFVMYHATSAQSAESILDEGQFRPSRESTNMLGAGVYASHTYQKAVNHGKAHIDYKGRFVVFKLLVYVGKVFSVTEEDDPMNKQWRQDHSSAWLAPDANLGMAPSGLQENCVKSPKQVHILGICRGWRYLSQEARETTLRLGEPESCGMDYEDCLWADKREFEDDESMMEELDDFTRRIGVKPFVLEDVSHEDCNYLADNYGDLGCWNLDETDLSFFWLRSGDGCIENAATGRFLYWDEDTDSIQLTRRCDYYDADKIWGIKWKGQASGALYNREAKGYLRISGDDREIFLDTGYPVSRFDHFQE